MAEGGDFYNENPYLDNAINNDGNEEEKEVNRTQPFTPQQSSTPYPSHEQIMMQTIQHKQSMREQSMMPSYEETSFGGDEIPLLGDFLSPEEKQSVIDRSIDFIKRKFPRVDLKKLGPISFSKKGTKPEIVSLGPKGGETKIFKQDGSGFLKSFTD